MLPLDVSGEAALTPDTRPLYPREAKLLQRYMREVNVPALPATLAEYVRTVVAPTLARERANGAVGIKFEAAYLRPLDFDDPDSAAAAKIYAKYAHSGVADARRVQDGRGLSLPRHRARSGRTEARRSDPRARDVRRLLRDARQRAASARAGVQRFDAARDEVRHRARRLAARRRDAGAAQQAERLRRHLDDGQHSVAYRAGRGAPPMARRMAGQSSVRHRRLRRRRRAGLGTDRVGRVDDGAARTRPSRSAA